MSRYYVLNGKEAVPADTLEFAKMFKNDNRRVALDKIGDVKISTVFLGINHQYGEGPPLIFETMIFGGEHDQYGDRYSTWEEAEKGHKVAVELVRSAQTEIEEAAPSASDNKGSPKLLCETCRDSDNCWVERLHIMKVSDKCPHYVERGEAELPASDNNL